MWVDHSWNYGTLNLVEATGKSVQRTDTRGLCSDTNVRLDRPNQSHTPVTATLLKYKEVHQVFSHLDQFSAIVDPHDARKSEESSKGCCEDASDLVEGSGVVQSQWTGGAITYVRAPTVDRPCSTKMNRD